MQKGFAVLPIILGILLISGALVGYLYFNRSTPTPLVKPVEQKDDLKTYTNEELGFQIQYDDRDLKVQEDTEEEFNKRGNGNFRKNFAYYVTYQPAEVLGIVAVLDETNSYDTNPLTIWIFNNPNNLTIEQWYKDFWYYPFVWGDYTEKRNNVAPTIEATISGRLAKYGAVTYQPNSPKFFYLPFNEKMYLFRVIGEQGEKIIQSFKFLKEGTDQNERGCVVGGCGSNLCDEKDIITTCEFKEEYACYKEAKCERQEDGKCGWTKTEKLTQCLKEKRSSSPDIIF